MSENGCSAGMRPCIHLYWLYSLQLLFLCSVPYILCLIMKIHRTIHRMKFPFLQKQPVILPITSPICLRLINQRIIWLFIKWMPPGNLQIYSRYSVVPCRNPLPPVKLPSLTNLSGKCLIQMSMDTIRYNLATMPIYILYRIPSRIQWR